MHRRTEQKEDGRLIHYYTFTPLNDESEPVDSSPSTPPDSPQRSTPLSRSEGEGAQG